MADTPPASGQRAGFFRTWFCMMFGHKIVFPKDMWADLECARCDWTGPDLPPWDGGFHA